MPRMEWRAVVEVETPINGSHRDERVGDRGAGGGGGGAYIEIK